MPENFDNIIKHVEQSSQSGRQLRQTIDQVMTALAKKGVQINVDFDSPTKELYRNLDAAKQNATLVSQQWELMEELITISALLTSTLDLDEVLVSVLDTVIRLTGAERAYLMLMQPDTEELNVHLARSQNQENLVDSDVVFSEGVIEAAINNREPVITTNAQADERFESRKSVMSHSLRSIIVVPLFLENEIIGVLYADNRIEAGIFRQESTPILAAYANQAAIAISNARLFEQVKDDLFEAQRRVEELEIQIDENRVREEVSKITENEFFEELSAKVEAIRARHNNSDE